jgi:hypothetical protein
MTNANALRHALNDAGFTCVPLFGKQPPEYGKNNSKRGLKGWQNLRNLSREMIDMWSKTWPDAENTGVLCFNTPACDIDVFDEAAAQACREYIRDRYEDAGNLLFRVGRVPKFATPFRTEEPFKKITVNLIAPDGSEGQKIEFLADGEQFVVAGPHPDVNKNYDWSNGGLEHVKHDDLPYIREEEARALVNELVEILIRDHGYQRAQSRPKNTSTPIQPSNGGTGQSDWSYLYENIRAGHQLHDSITVLAGKMIACGTNPGAAIHQLRALLESSEAPKDERWRARVSEIPRAVDSAIAKFGKQSNITDKPPPTATEQPADALIVITVALAAIETADTVVVIAKRARPTPFTIEQTINVFESWLVLSSTAPVYAMLGTVAANLLPGDPVWLGLIAPPSSAKSELLNSISELPNVVDADTITPSGLLSGTPEKQKDRGARGGLLRQIGSFGIITLKDFGSVLSMHAETRAETLAALRKIYDGAWTRHLGSAGGKTLSWKGKVAIIFAATEVIDAHHSVISSMGDRFLLSRLKPVTGKKQFTRALKHTGGGFNQMRKELARAVTKLFANRRATASMINEQETEAIGKAIALAVRLRGAVARDYHSREIEAIYSAEGTARIGLALERLLAGLDTLGMDRTKALTVVTEVALDSVPPLRRRAYDCVYKYGNVETADVAIDLGLPTNTARRILEDLASHGLVIRHSQGPGKADVWDRTDWEAEEAKADAD